MQTDSVEKAAGVGAIGLWAAMHGWLGWLVVLYAACMMLDCLTGTAQAIKNGEWSSHKARQGLWHKGGSIIMVFVSVLTDILLGLTLNHISGLTLPFNYDMIATVYKGNIIKNLIMDCQSYTKYRPNETTGGIFVSWRRKEELPTGA